MRFAFLGSGSGGNGFLVEQGSTCLMIDCGFSAKEAERRLALLGKSPSQLTGILVTHEHGDHINGVGKLARKYGLHVWLSAGTYRADRTGELPTFCLFNSHESLAIEELQVNPFPVPHDAYEPCQFTFTNGAEKLGLLTDLGCETPHIIEQLNGCDALVLECNHDAQMLANGSYPPHLKRRVGGDHGHLSNKQAANLLQKLDNSRLKHIVAAHLSEKHNTPRLAREALSEVLCCAPEWVAVAEQLQGLAWRDVA